MNDSEIVIIIMCIYNEDFKNVKELYNITRGLKAQTYPNLNLMFAYFVVSSVHYTTVKYSLWQVLE